MGSPSEEIGTFLKMSSESEKYLKVIFELIQEASTIALKFSAKSEPSLKSDTSVVTKADKMISKLAQKQLEPFLKTKKHILIDEEDPKVGLWLSQENLKKSKYIWAIDPIDGSRNYANGMPNFGLSIGILKDLKPWLGVVYFPVFNELLYCDGRSSYIVQNPFTKKQKKKLIKRAEVKIDNAAIFLCNDQFFKTFHWDYKDCRVMIQACAAIDLCWSALGRVCGCIIRCSLWDFAGSWPILKNAGLELRDFDTGRVIDCVDVNLFLKENTPWKLNGFLMACSEKNYPALKKKITSI